MSIVTILASVEQVNTPLVRFTYLSHLQSDTEDDEIVITKVVLNDTSPSKGPTTVEKIESTEDEMDLSEDEDDNRVWFDESFRLYLSEVRHC